MVQDDKPVGLDGVVVEFDDDRVVCDAGVMLVATLAQRLGVEALAYVALRPRVEFERDVDAETVARLHHAAHERCYVANSVSCPVEVQPWGP